ncbi:hypothetical protein BaRGS_00030974, partial [Batillaria attramentaria]
EKTWARLCKSSRTAANKSWSIREFRQEPIRGPVHDCDEGRGKKKMAEREYDGFTGSVDTGELYRLLDSVPESCCTRLQDYRITAVDSPGRAHNNSLPKGFNLVFEQESDPATLSAEGLVKRRGTVRQEAVYPCLSDSQAAPSTAVYTLYTPADRWARGYSRNFKMKATGSWNS